MGQSGDRYPQVHCLGSAHHMACYVPLAGARAVTEEGGHLRGLAAVVGVQVALDAAPARMACRLHFKWIQNKLGRGSTSEKGDTADSQ